jgi:hypothetical protein
MKLKFIWFTIVSFFILHQTVLACEPAIPLVQILFGSIVIPKSIIVLSSTVFFKCLAFAYFEKTLVWWKAIIFLFIANLYSTFIGIIAVFPASVPSCLPGLLIIAVLAYFPAKRLALHYFKDSPEKVRSVTFAVTALITVIFFIALVLAIGIQNLKYPLNQGEYANFSSFGSYYFYKLSFIYASLLFSIFITIFYEEWCVAKLVKRGKESPIFLTSVSRANYVALAFMMIVSAIMTLPERIQNQDFGFLLR